ncbi:MAG: hypothetical protein HY290_12980, partial [Planctomycetia bacterium]|nr:hypothetical protein [Planctomycetia bacterium]
ISSGSPEHYYRLDIDTGQRVAFAVPAVVERGKSSRVTLFGWNLVNRAEAASSQLASEFDQVEIEIPATVAQPTWPLPVRLAPAQAEFSGFAYHLSGSHAAIAMGVSDVPVVTDRTDNHSPQAAQLLTCPCEISGRLALEDERDWYAFEARRGEVLHIEGLAERIGSPLDLDISICDAANGQKLAQFSDSVGGNTGSAFAASHFDPTGRWVAPADGLFQIVMRNLGGGLPDDPRRVYRLSVRREESEYQVVALPHSDGPAGLNVRRGGRELLDLVAFRRRGFAGPIRVTARDLPAGVECPDVWIGQGVDRALLVVSAQSSAPNALGKLQLESIAGSGAQPADLKDRRPVRAGTIVRSGAPGGWGRMTSEIPLAVAGEAPVHLSANGHETLNHHLYGNLQVKHSPGGILDVAVDVERRQPEHSAPVKLIAAGLSEAVTNQTAIISAGQSRGYLSFYLPPNLPLGPYSLVVKGETTVPGAESKLETVVVYSNPVTFEVESEAFLVEVDPFAPTRARRGETLQVRYAAQRRNGFIGKMHTELAAPGRVTVIPGLRGRGETFVGQTDHGSLQIVVNDDAPLGRQQFLRLFTVGVREDQPTFFGSCFLPLEIVE